MRYQNKRNWPQLLFDHKFESMTELMIQYNDLGERILLLVDVPAYLAEDYELSPEEYDELVREYEKLADIWGVASILVDEANEPAIGRGLHTYDVMLRSIGTNLALDHPVSRIEHDGDVSLTSSEGYHTIAKETQETIRNEIKQPISEFR